MTNELTMSMFANKQDYQEAEIQQLRKQVAEEQAIGDKLLAKQLELSRQVAELEDRLEAVSTESVVQRITIAELESDLATANQDWHNLNTENNALSLQVAQLEAKVTLSVDQLGRMILLYDKVQEQNNTLSLQVAQLREALTKITITNGTTPVCTYQEMESIAKNAINTTPSQDEWIKRSELEAQGYKKLYPRCPKCDWGHDPNGRCLTL